MKCYTTREIEVRTKMSEIKNIVEKLRRDLKELSLTCFGFIKFIKKALFFDKLGICTIF